MKIELIIIIGIIGIVTSLVFFTLPRIPTIDYSLEIDALKDPETIFVNARVILTNNGKLPIQNIMVDFGNMKTTKLIVLQPSEKVILSPPEGSDLSVVKINASNGINMVKEYRSPVKLPGMIGS